MGRMWEGDVRLSLRGGEPQILDVIAYPLDGVAGLDASMLLATIVE
jgi:hypothetical protein